MRTRIVIRHDPALVVGLIAHRRGRRRTTRHLAREIARRLSHIFSAPIHRVTNLERRWGLPARRRSVAFGVPA
jgi:hypothetical protein